MTRLRATLESIRAENRAAFIPYLTAGDPSPRDSVTNAQALSDGGADVIELGIPFSDPLADGPVLQRAAERARAAGTRMRDVLDCAADVARRTPVVLMTYANPVLRWGWERFVGDAVSSGVTGVILTDVPPEEAAPFLPAAQAADLATIFLVAPTSGPERVRAVVAVSTGFVYCVSRLGVTGAGASLSDAFRGALDEVRRVSDIPVGVGFGISTAEHARDAGRLADAVIVGSHLVAKIEAVSPQEAAETLRTEATLFRRALEGART